MKTLRKSTIFVEGAEDSRFLQDVIQEWFGIELTAPPLPKKDPKAKNEADLSYDFVNYGGKTNIALLKPLFRENSLNHLKNVLFIDADTYLESEQWSGLQNTRAYLQHLRDVEKITIDYAYIFPNATEISLSGESDEDTEGELETILKHIATEQEFLRCWDGFCSCLETHNAKNVKRYVVPDDKAKFYAYVDTVKQDKQKSGGTERLYRNSLWNLDSEGEDIGSKRYLKPLKHFLDEILKLENS